MGAPSPVTSPQPEAGGGGVGEQDDGGEGQGRIRYRDSGHSPMTRPAAGSGAAARSSRGPGRPPPGPRQTKLLPWPAPTGLAPLASSVCLSVRPAGRARDSPGLLWKLLEQPLPLPPPGSARWPPAGAREAGPSPHPLTGPRTGLEPSGLSAPPSFHPQPSAACPGSEMDSPDRDHDQGQGPSLTTPHKESAVQADTARRMDRGDLTRLL